VLPDDGQDRLGQARAVRPEHELDVILLDQPLGELGAARGRRLVVVVADRELLVFARDIDTALLIDLGDGEIVTVLGVGAVLGIFAGERDSGAKDDDVLCFRSSTGTAPAQEKRRAEACQEPTHKLQSINPRGRVFSPNC
jgi:hypothetical protein